jgi:hypothetical protein
MVDFSKVIADAVAKGEDQTVAQVGGGGIKLNEYIPAGIHRARFVSYIEIGKQKAMYKGAPKEEYQVILAFEISGPRVKPREDGQPHVIELRPMNKSLNDKAGFFKLFQRMNHAGKAKHMAELLGQPFRVEVFHNTTAAKDGKPAVTYVNLRKDGEPYAILPPVSVNEETGESTTVAVEPQRSPTRLFLWDFADLEQWASIFIEGTWEERKDEKTGAVTKPARSKNVLQGRVAAALNFKGSPIQQLLVAGGVAIDVPDAETMAAGDSDEGPDATADVGSKAPVDTPVPTGAAATDALAGIV